MRAAQYVRMSTEHQQYSIENQAAAIAVYASQHGFEIVRTYSDEARSGIDLLRRQGLRQLLDDVVTLRADFQIVLVYDVSRWGRFQDSDESAHYEFLCKSAGVKVVYCAEAFPNDDSIASALLKSLRRTMAGEYLRDLSARVFAGQCRIARNGYKLGGAAGYGLRRLLLDCDGVPKKILAVGERKYLTTERVTYVWGPTWEVKTVRKIYSLFLQDDLNCNAIAKRLKKYHVPRQAPLIWTRLRVKRILSHPKYMGAIVFNQKSSRLRSKVRPNPRDQWVIELNRFPPIIPPSQFEQAQRKLQDRVLSRSDERLLLDLRSFVSNHGTATQKMLLRDPAMATATTYAHRFGSFRRALEMITDEPTKGFSIVQHRLRLKFQLHDSFTHALCESRVPFTRNCGVYISPMPHPTLLDVARCFTLDDGTRRWEIRYSRKGGEGAGCIAGRLSPDNRSVTDYVFIPSLPKAVQKIRLSEDYLRRIGFITPTLEDAVRLLLSGTRTAAST